MAVLNTRLQLAHWIAELFDSRLPYFKGARQLRNALTSLLSPRLRLPQTVSTRYGFTVEITSEIDSIDYHLYTRGTYEAGTLSVISHCLNEGDVFIDVGANIGLMSLLAAKRVGQSGMVYAFEPDPDTFKLLQNNSALNQFDNVCPVNAGLGSVQEDRVIYRNRHSNRGMNSFIDRNVGAAEGIEVPVGTLDRFLAEQGVRTVKMMKIDVEGWELEVLKGAQTLLSGLDSPILCVEYNTQLAGHEAVYEFIKAHNEYLIYILPHGDWHVSRLVRVESLEQMPTVSSFNIFCFLPIHLQSFSRDLFV